MKLRDRNRSPVGGFYYRCPILNRTLKTGGGLDKLVRYVEDVYFANKIEIPGNLSLIIEDQICTRQPADRCYYTKGLGDGVSMVIHSAAKVVDRILGTKLEKRARGCSGCSKRRAKLNAVN